MQLEKTQRLAQGAARHAVALDHLLLGEQAIARSQSAPMHLADDISSEDRGGLGAARPWAPRRARWARLTDARRLAHANAPSRPITAWASRTTRATISPAGRMSLMPPMPCPAGIQVFVGSVAGSST